LAWIAELFLLELELQGIFTVLSFECLLEALLRTTSRLIERTTPSIEVLSISVSWIDFEVDEIALGGIFLQY
jgi:hypothetical protein